MTKTDQKWVVWDIDDPGDAEVCDSKEAALEVLRDWGANGAPEDLLRVGRVVGVRRVKLRVELQEDDDPNPVEADDE